MCEDDRQAATSSPRTKASEWLEGAAGKENEGCKGVNCSRNGAPTTSTASSNSVAHCEVTQPYGMPKEQLPVKGLQQREPDMVSAFSCKQLIFRDPRKCNCNPLLSRSSTYCDDASARSLRL